MSQYVEFHCNRHGDYLHIRATDADHIYERSRPMWDVDDLLPEIDRLHWIGRELRKCLKQRVRIEISDYEREMLERDLDVKTDRLIACLVLIGAIVILGCSL